MRRIGWIAGLAGVALGLVLVLMGDAGVSSLPWLLLALGRLLRSINGR